MGLSASRDFCWLTYYSGTDHFVAMPEPSDQGRYNRMRSHEGVMTWFLACIEVHFLVISCNGSIVRSALFRKLCAYELMPCVLQYSFLLSELPLQCFDLIIFVCQPIKLSQITQSTAGRVSMLPPSNSYPGSTIAPGVVASTFPALCNLFGGHVGFSLLGPSYLSLG